MADYITTPIKTTKDELQDKSVALNHFAAVSYARAELAEPDPEDSRLFITITVPREATHAIAIAFGEKPASESRHAFVIEPGGSFDTSELSAERQPTQRITAWTGPDLCRQGDCQNTDPTIHCRVLQAYTTRRRHTC